MVTKLYTQKLNQWHSGWLANIHYEQESYRNRWPSSRQPVRRAMKRSLCKASSLLLLLFSWCGGDQSTRVMVSMQVGVVTCYRHRGCCASINRRRPGADANWSRCTRLLHSTTNWSGRCAAFAVAGHVAADIHHGKCTSRTAIFVSVKEQVPTNPWNLSFRHQLTINKTFSRQIKI